MSALNLGAAAVAVAGAAFAQSLYLSASMRRAKGPVPLHYDFKGRPSFWVTAPVGAVVYAGLVGAQAVALVALRPPAVAWLRAAVPLGGGLLLTLMAQRQALRIAAAEVSPGPVPPALALDIRPVNAIIMAILTSLIMC